MGRLLRLLAVVVLLAAALLAAALGFAHASIRRQGGPLPDLSDVRALAVPDDAPVALLAVDTASQAMPRAAVLDGRDPTPEAPYVMSHPAFLLRWDDGRGLLVDLGMEPEAARRFGRPMEWIGAEPIRPHAAAAAQLADVLAGARLGLLFTHLHTDHVQGALALCAARGDDAVEWFQTPAQAERSNYTTRPGVALLGDAACLRRSRLEAAPLAGVPGFPGVHVAHVAGHTPGSQVVVAHVRGPDRVRTVIFTGDTVNHVDGARLDVSKPLLYRLLVVPEDDARLGAVRRLLGAAERELGAELAVAHDRRQLEALGLLGGTARP